MYGPSWTFSFEIGKKYEIPAGYGGSGGDLFGGEYFYEKYIFIGQLERKNPYEKFLVFKKQNGIYVLCCPHASVSGFEISLNMNPRYYGTLKELKKELGNLKWETFVSGTKLEDYPEI